MVIVCILFTAIVFHLTAIRNTKYELLRLLISGLSRAQMACSSDIEYDSTRFCSCGLCRRMVCIIWSDVAFLWWVSCDRCRILLLIAVDRNVISLCGSIGTDIGLVSIVVAPPSLFSHIIPLAVFNSLDVNTHLSPCRWHRPLHVMCQRK